jgi:hypothetical protein
MRCASPGSEVERDGFVVVTAKPARSIKLSFKEGGRDDFSAELKIALTRKSWLTEPAAVCSPTISGFVSPGSYLCTCPDLVCPSVRARNRWQSVPPKNSQPRALVLVGFCPVSMKRGAQKLRSQTKRFPASQTLSTTPSKS